MTEHHSNAVDTADSIKSEDIDAPDPAQVPHPHRDASILRYLYFTERMTQAEIADRLDVSQATISTWMAKHDINTVQGHGSFSIPAEPKNGEGSSAYPRFCITLEGEQHEFKVHQITILPEADTADVFGEDRECHHRLPMTVAFNVCANIEPMAAEDHGRIEHPDGDTTPEEADTAATLEDIEWEQSGVPLEAIRGLHGSTVPVGSEDSTADGDGRAVATDGGEDTADDGGER